MSTETASLNRDAIDRDVTTPLHVSEPISNTNELNSVAQTVTTDEPKTPPQSRMKPVFHSPENTYTSLPPATPSVNSSTGLKSSNIPETPLPSGKQSPPLKSPSSFYRQNENEDGSTPAIKQISSTLKSRLSHAFVRYKRTSKEAENSLEDTKKEIEQQTQFLLASPVPNSSRSHSTSSSKVYKPLMKSPLMPISRSPRTFNRRLSTDSMDGDDGSANFAFIQALSKRKSSRKTSTGDLVTGSRLYASPKLSPTKQLPRSSTIPGLTNILTPSTVTTTSSTINNGNTQYTEADAVASLMSLSSPTRPATHSRSANDISSLLSMTEFPRKKIELEEVNNDKERKVNMNISVESDKEDEKIVTDVDTEYEDEDVTADEEMED